MFGRMLLSVSLLGFAAAAHAHDADEGVECRSRNYEYAECAADFRHPRLLQQLSDSDCVEDQSWGYNRRHGAIWVTNGCAGVFGESHGRRRDDGDYGDDDRRDRRDRDDDRDYDRDRYRERRTQTIECRSSGYAFTRCSVDWSEARLIEQLSNSDCIEGRSWGLDDDGLWVDKGCAGRFAGH